MTASLRPFARSRFLRLMGVLAWLMLVASSLAAAPLGMHGHAGDSSQAAAATVGGHCLVIATAQPSPSPCVDYHGCCDKLAAHGCGCAAMCISVVPSTATILTGPAAIAVVYGPTFRVSAPSPDTAPPMRPPLV